MAPVTFFLRLAVLAVAALATASCYLPSDFQADLRITPSGDYNFQYRGLLIHLPLLEKLTQDRLTPEEVRASVRAVERDLARDRSFEEIVHVEQATFRVRYRKIGNIEAERTFNFVRMNARVFVMERYPDGTARIFGDRPNPDVMRRVTDSGLRMQGRLRVQTEARILRQNAGEIQRGGAPIYIWHIDGPDRSAPELVFALQR